MIAHLIRGSRRDANKRRRKIFRSRRATLPPPPPFQGAAWVAFAGAQCRGHRPSASCVLGDRSRNMKLGPGPGHLAVHSFLSSRRDLCYHGISQRRLVVPGMGRANHTNHWH